MTKFGTESVKVKILVGVKYSIAIFSSYNIIEISSWREDGRNTDEVKVKFTAS